MQKLSEKKAIRLLFWIFVSFILYFNTLSHGFVLDDGLVITENGFTQKGIAGLPEIFSKDTYFSYYQQFGRENLLEQGRYRPLSVATFALEQEFFGNNAKVRHFGNIILFALMMFLTAEFLQKYFFSERKKTFIFVALLYAAHPIHTEIVANIKGRDEILMLLFLMLSLLLFFKNFTRENSKLTESLLSGFCFFLSLMSKESALPFIFLLPIITFYLYGKVVLGKKFLLSWTIFSLFGVLYMLLRLAVLGFQTTEVNDILNNPYALAEDETAILSKTAILFEYLKKSILPVSFSFDYSYQHFDYVKNFYSPRFLLSLVLHSGMFYLAIKSLLKRESYGAGLWIYLFSILLISNFFVNIGATMADRLLHLPLLGFYIFAGLYIERFEKYFDEKSMYLNIAIVLYLSFFVVRTWVRNADWKNNETLFLHDVKVVPNSLKANTAAASSAILMGDKTGNQIERTEFYQKSLKFSEKAELIYPEFVEIYINKGVAYSRLENLAKAKENWEKAEKIFPTYDMTQYKNTLAEMYMREGLRYGSKNNFKAAKENFDKGLKYNALSADIWFHKGGAYFSEHQLDSAIFCFEKSLQIRPAFRDALNALGTAKNMKESQTPVSE
jgi:tetratricopeptide (TPR) repeat protein